MRLFQLTFFLVILSFTSMGQDTDFDKMLKEEYKYTVPLIKPSEVAKLLEKGETIYFLDTRSESEFKTSSIKGAVHVGFAGFSMKKVKQVEKDDFIVVYCTIGARSETVGEKIIGKGYTNVHNLYGGIINWVNEGYPVYLPDGTETQNVHVYSWEWGKWLKKGNPVF